MLSANSSASEISLDEIEGERGSTDDFVFVRIGSSIPLSSSSFSFDVERPPSQPLSISNRHGLLFISHPQQGFFVVKTTDVIAASKEIEEDNSKKLSVEDVCVMDVKIGSVGFLAVSDDEDESLLAAAVGGEILFYKVASLLNKMQEPAFSTSLSSSVTVKDFKWQKKMTDTSFVVLSTHGSLYHSTSEAKLNKIMDGVDAVDWSREGDHTAVARKHSIRILSSDFEEILNMPLIFKSWQTLTGSGGTIVVDSIKWLLDDSIILGCHQLDEDGAEEGYLIQVIKSQKKKFSEMPCNPIIYSFSDLFDGVWDILPSGFGPYLLANYLDHWGAVLLSNKKAVDQHISLLKWSSMDDNNKVIALKLISDKYTPKIEAPVIGDKNLVFGFCIGTVPTYEKINIKVDGNVHELSPRYALFCLTSEGRLIMFHAARISEPIDLHQTLPHLDDGDVEQRQFNTNFVNESIAEPVCIQISSSKDLPKQINMESLNFQKGTFELPGHAISPPKQPVGTFTGQTGKSDNLFSDTVRDVTEELDILMSYIEKEGGFMDACTSYQENSVHVLDDLWHLSERSHNCQKSLDEQLMDIQQLQNKMLQVSARQSYVKGLVELASNKTYWYIWNRWKLDPDLEVKQRNILNANQNLTGEIIELERYFNALEINKFGDIGGSTSDHAAFRSHQASLRRKPLLQSLSNTVDFQLSAAEQLSELLSRQTSNLNINSCLLEKKGITHEFIGSISLPQEHNSFQSPPPACKSVSLLQNSIRTPHLSTTNSLEGYNQRSSLNLINTSEPGAPRRRRDSLDRHWTTFKSATVKRETPQKFFRVEKDVPFRKAKRSFDAKKKDFEAHQKRALDNGSRQQLEVGSKVIPMWTNDTTGSPSIESSSHQVVGLQRTSTSSPSPSHSFSTVSGTQSCTNNSTSSSESTTATTAPLTSASMTSMPFGDSSFSGRLGDSVSSTLAATSACLSAHLILLSSSSSSTLAATSASLSAHPVSSPSSSSSPLSSTSPLPLSASSSSSLLPYSSSFGQPLFSVFTSSSTAHVSMMVAEPIPSAISTDKPNSDSELASPKSTMSEKVETSLSLPNSSSGSLPTNNTNMPSFVSQPQSAASSSITTLSSTEDKSKPSDANLSDQEEDGMEEEDSDMEGGLHFSRIGLGSTISSTPPKQISFGSSFLTASSSSQSSESSPFTLQTSPAQGEVSSPASFTIPSSQPTQPSSSSPLVSFSEFGQTSKIGGGPQALGPVLGSFGVSREISACIVQNSGSSSTNNVINRGFGFDAPGVGFTTAAAKGGFAAVSSSGSGGFGAFSSGGGFSGAGSGGGFVGTHSGGGFGGVGSNASSGFCPVAGCFGSGGAASGFKSAIDNWEIDDETMNDCYGAYEQSRNSYNTTMIRWNLFNSSYQQLGD